MSGEQGVDRVLRGRRPLELRAVEQEFFGAGLAAALAKGEGPERVYIVEPTGSFEPDPNVTDKKFPGNPTRSYRTRAPLKIIGEVTDWARQAPEELQKWREKLANVKGEIIN